MNPPAPGFLLLTVRNSCAWNPYRLKQPYYYGNNETFKVDTSKPMTVATQFPANEAGKLVEIRRLYVQDGVVIRADDAKVEGLPAVDAMNDDFCQLTGSRRFMDLGAHEGMGDALARGMVLAMSIRWDEGGHMQWLDGAADGAGPCNATEGAPRNIRLVEPNPEVTFGHIKRGEIGSTFKRPRALPSAEARAGLSLRRLCPSLFLAKHPLLLYPRAGVIPTCKNPAQRGRDMPGWRPERSHEGIA